MPDVSEQMFRTNRFGSFRELGRSCLLRAGSKSMIPGRTREYGSRREKRYVPVIEQNDPVGCVAYISGESYGLYLTSAEIN